MKQELINIAEQSHTDNNNTLKPIEKASNNTKGAIAIEDINGVSDSEEHVVGSQVNRSNSKAGKKGKGKATNLNSKRKVVIIGDSQLRKINGEKLSKDHPQCRCKSNARRKGVENKTSKHRQ